MELFKCVRLQGARLTRTSCASRHRSSNEAPTRGGIPDVRESACRECPIGAAHLRGEAPGTWPNGTPIELVPFSALGTPMPPLVRPKTLPVVQMGGRGARFVRAPRQGDAPIRSGAPPAAKPTAPPEAPAPTRTAMEITHKGKTQSIAKWAAQVGMTAQALRARLDRGWTEAEALDTPKGDLPKRMLENPTAPQHKAAAKAKAAEAPAPPPAVEPRTEEPKSAHPSAESGMRALRAVGEALGLDLEEAGTVDGWQLIAVRPVRKVTITLGVHDLG